MKKRKIIMIIIIIIIIIIITIISNSKISTYINRSVLLSQSHHTNLIGEILSLLLGITRYTNGQIITRR